MESFAELETYGFLEKKHKHATRPHSIVYMTPDVSWIQEEETLLALNTIPPKQPLTSIDIDFLFINSDSLIVDVFQRKQRLDVSGNVSLLPKESILFLVERAKQQLAPNGKYVFEDFLVWNAGIEPERLFQYAESDDPTAIGTGFSRGSIFYDLVLDPSVFVFHSNQQIFMIFRERDIVFLKKHKP